MLPSFLLYGYHQSLVVIAFIKPFISLVAAPLMNSIISQKGFQGFITRCPTALKTGRHHNVVVSVEVFCFVLFCWKSQMMRGGIKYYNWQHFTLILFLLLCSSNFWNTYCAFSHCCTHLILLHVLLMSPLHTYVIIIFWSNYLGFLSSIYIFSINCQADCGTNS